MPLSPSPPPFNRSPPPGPADRVTLGQLNCAAVSSSGRWLLLSTLAAVSDAFPGSHSGAAAAPEISDFERVIGNRLGGMMNKFSRDVVRETVCRFEEVLVQTAGSWSVE